MARPEIVVKVDARSGDRSSAGASTSRSQRALSETAADASVDGARSRVPGFTGRLSGRVRSQPFHG